MTDEKDVKKVIDKMKFMEDEKKVKTLVKELIICAKAARKPYMPLIAIRCSLKDYNNLWLPTNDICINYLAQYSDANCYSTVPYVLCHMYALRRVTTLFPLYPCLLTATIDLMCFPQIFLPDLHNLINSNPRKLAGW